MDAMDYETANCKLHISKCIEEGNYSSHIERPLKPKGEIVSLQQLVSELHTAFSSERVNVEHVSQLMLNYKSDRRQWRKFAKFDRFRYTRNLVDAGNGLFNIMVLCWGPGHASAIHDHADSHCFMKILQGDLEEVRYEWPERAKPAILRRKETKTSNNLCSKCKRQSEQNGAHETQENGANSDSCQLNVDSCQTDDSDCDACCHIDKPDDRCRDEYDESDQMVELSRTRLEENDVCYINDTLGLHRVENPSHVEGTVSLHLYCPPFDACRVFDARTGRPARANVTFWSVGGKRLAKMSEE